MCAKCEGREAESARLKAVRNDRTEKKRTAAETAAKLLEDFARCPGKGRCSCGVLPCPMEKYEICEFCPESVRVPKPGKCKVRACCEARKQAGQSLLLMGPSETLALTGPA